MYPCSSYDFFGDENDGHYDVVLSCGKKSIGEYTPGFVKGTVYANIPYYEVYPCGKRYISCLKPGICCRMPLPSSLLIYRTWKVYKALQ